jgi:hypothetical protein
MTRSTKQRTRALDRLMTHALRIGRAVATSESRRSRARWWHGLPGTGSARVCDVDDGDADKRAARRSVADHLSETAHFTPPTAVEQHAHRAAPRAVSATLLGPLRHG